MKFFTSLIVCGLIVFSASWASADILDGSRVGDPYGAAVSVQTVQTQFGDNQSELNAAYSYVANGTLHLILTGQVENNFNKLNIFFDTNAATGQNTIGADTNSGGVNPGSFNDNIFDNYSGIGPEGSGNGPGFTFDSGFNADFVFIARNGNFGGDRFDLNFLSIGNDSTAFEATDIFGGSQTGTATNLFGQGIDIGYDNSNTGGVAGGTEAADQAAALAVETGLELFIPLSVLGVSEGDIIRISAHVNNSNHDYLSNQSLGGFLAPQGNPGGDNSGGFNNDVSLINLNDYAGNQFFSVNLTAIPEPGSLAALLIGGTCLLARRRRDR